MVYHTMARPPVGCAFQGLEFLAPPWEIVAAHKYRGGSDEQYIAAYRKHLSHPDRNYLVAAWIESLRPEEDITLCCACPEGKFCHRRLLAEWIGQKRPDLEIVVH